MFIVLNPEGDPVFNSETGGSTFETVSEAEIAIDDELDEPEAECGECGHVSTMESETGWSRSDYEIYRLVKV